MIKQYNKTIQFYGLSLVIPWLLWTIAAIISHLSYSSDILTMLQGVLGIMGLIAPMLVAAYLFFSNQELFDDLKQRIFKVKNANPVYTLLAITLIFSSIVLAQLISVLFGYNISQFHISGQPSFTSAVFSPWFILVFAPVVEELAWHSYGTDTLRSRFNLFNTCMIFAVYWVIWHLPLSFIKGYYHSNIVAEGWIYSLNFVFSLFVFVVLMNWLYYKTNRNILITIFFHLSANISNEIFATHPMSKVIQTGILLIVSFLVLYKDRKMFFEKI
jgi:hypothetical protein